MNWRSLEKLDRRWLFLAMALLVAGPLLWPVGLPIVVSSPVQRFHDAIAAVPDGSPVLVPCDFDPGSRPELIPMMKTVLRQLFDKKCRPIVTCLWPGGPALVDQTLESVADEYRARGVPLESGVDYLDLGYKSGNEAVMVLMGQGIARAFPRDLRGRETRSLPILRDVGDYSSIPLLVSISGGYPGTKEWVQQVNARFHLPMVSGCTAVSAPEYYPYLQSGQLRGLLGGMAGAAEYEKLRGEKGSATRGMDAQSLAHVFIALCIVLGNVVQWRRGTGGRS
ncbi:MAG: hypothetical protein IT347_00845 [Candidatus Eisenbacteria bacterium]|nr:hypothetical protein [Candidatus Eisenbacteria bacterium]